MPVLGARQAGLPTVAREEFQRRVLEEQPDVTTFVLFDRGTEEDRITQDALADAVRRHAGRMRAFRADARAFASYFQELQAGRRDFDSFDFNRWPAVGVYRRGRLLTTFNPRRVFYLPKLQAREVREQLDVFLTKMVYYDPSKVREQTNLEVVQKEHGEKEPAGSREPRPEA
jgi:hypothetical protein